jgi:hypothetical protein
MPSLATTGGGTTPSKKIPTNKPVRAHQNNVTGNWAVPLACRRLAHTPLLYPGNQMSLALARFLEAYQVYIRLPGREQIPEEQGYDWGRVLFSYNSPLTCWCQ